MPTPTPAQPRGTPGVFRVKGVIYQGTQAYFEEQVPGGMAALVAEIKEPELASFITQRFLPSSFYDVLPVVPLIKYEARAVGLTVRSYLLGRSQFQAQKDLGTLYKFLLKLVSLEQVAQRVPRIILQLFDFGTPVVEQAEKGRVSIRLEGWPAALVEWSEVAFTVYLEAALVLSNASYTNVLVSVRAREPPQAGIECVTMGVDVDFA